MEIVGNKDIQYQFLGEHPIVRTYKGDELMNEYKPLYNPPLDWKDIRSDCPENSIALYAAHGRINNPNYNIKKVTGAVKYTVVGSPTINNGIVSGFSSSDYLKTSILPLSSANSFEINLKISADNPEGTYTQIAGNENTIAFQFGGGVGKLYVYVSDSNGKSELTYTYTQQSQISTIKLVYQNSTYSLYVNGNFIESLEKGLPTTNYPFGLGTKMYGNSNGSGFLGSVDLNETYIKVNNQMWFGSQMQLTSANPNLYLQSSGTQYIDTGVYADDSTGIKLKVNVQNKINGDAMYIGSRNTSSNQAIQLEQYGDSVTLYFLNSWNTYYPINQSPVITSEIGNYINIELNYKNSRACMFNGTSANTYLTSQTLTTQTRTLFLYARNNGSAEYYYSGKMGSVEITQGNNVIRNFVPVPQGLVIGNFTCPSNGMFDIVEQKFYGNQGTGDFTYGNDSPETITYDNLGFIANCTGGYKVFIDDNQYGGIRTSGSQCNIIWSQSGINTGDDITTPSALKAHKIWIEPATEGNNITAFNCARVAASGYETQGVLWGHFNLQNNIRIRYLFSRANNYKNILFALTAKNNKISFTGSLTEFVDNQPNLEYLPTLISKDGVIDMPGAFSNCSKNKVITLKDATIASAYNAFSNNLLLEEIKCNNTKVVIAHSSLNSMYYDCRKLKAFIPTTFTSSLQRMSSYAVNCQSIEDTIIDVRGATNLKNIDVYSQNATYFAAGIKGLRVSNEAPFDYGTAPQINVSYTGMDRSALVQLFNDLPYNVGYTVIGSPTINNGVASGFSASNCLKLDKQINFHYAPYEVATKITTPSTWDYTVSGRSVDTILGGNANKQGLYIYNSLSSNVGKLNFYGATNGQPWSDDAMAFQLSLDTSYYVKYGWDGDKTFYLSISTDGTTWQTHTRQDTYAPTDETLNFYFGFATYYGTYWRGLIDLNNTYIKINDVYWFRGQPAMTKTINVVGCTGTNSLTNDDKAIVTNKNWTLTVS